MDNIDDLNVVHNDSIIEENIEQYDSVMADITTFSAREASDSSSIDGNTGIDM